MGPFLERGINFREIFLERGANLESRAAHTHPKNTRSRNSDVFKLYTKYLSFLVYNQVYNSYDAVLPMAGL